MAIEMTSSKKRGTVFNLFHHSEGDEIRSKENEIVQEKKLGTRKSRRLILDKKVFFFTTKKKKKKKKWWQ